ncbi:hypothetical protein PsorP6_005088 [Peronosclerospora sorghi]|uniref:Uncharacterized protein n=1 Tax=Peronosclerospora sorghi TaxID=230839 RepID=A0ACC0W5F1_9STRA|nr:hypothetical protein PsorP6_005088 [Peronosclerospora sorghi]
MMEHLSPYTSQSWSSTHQDFRRLRFFVWTGGDPGFTLTTAGDSLCSVASDEYAELRVEHITSSKMSKTPSIIRLRSSTSNNRMRYDIMLKRPKLGVKFAGDGSHDIPIVVQKADRRLSLQGSHCDSISVSEICLGDVLVAVNGKDTVAAGLNMAMNYLKTCPRPVKLTFERPVHDDNVNDGKKIKGQAAKNTCSTLSPLCQNHTNRSGRENVVIKWEYGPLGVTMLEDAISGVPIVNRLTGKGSAANMERLQHGFYLHSINGSLVEGHSLNQIYRDLLMLSKPVTLVFFPPRSDDTSDASGEYQRNSDSWSSSIAFDRSSDRELEPDAHRATVTASSAHRCSEQVSSIRDEYEYEVVWTSTRLGLQLKMLHNSNQKSAKKDKAVQKPTRCQYPIIHQVLEESTLDLPSDAVGHLFVSINNWCIAGLGVSELRTLLGATSKPALLRFRRREGIPGFQRTFLSTSSYDTDETSMHRRKRSFGSLYSILWSQGKLGIVFGCFEESDQPNTLTVYVKSIGPGQAQKSKLVGIGDILCSINGRELPPKQHFKKNLRSLVHTMQPVTLVFRRVTIPNWVERRS